MILANFTALLMKGILTKGELQIMKAAIMKFFDLMVVGFTRAQTVTLY